MAYKIIIFGHNKRDTTTLHWYPINYSIQGYSQIFSTKIICLFGHLYVQ